MYRLLCTAGYNYLHVYLMKHLMYSWYSTFIIGLPSDIKLTKGLVKVLRFIPSYIAKFEGLRFSVTKVL